MIYCEKETINKNELKPIVFLFFKTHLLIYYGIHHKCNNFQVNFVRQMNRKPIEIVEEYLSKQKEKMCAGNASAVDQVRLPVSFGAGTSDQKAFGLRTLIIPD